MPLHFLTLPEVPMRKIMRSDNFDSISFSMTNQQVYETVRHFAQVPKISVHYTELVHEMRLTVGKSTQIWRILSPYDFNAGQYALADIDNSITALDNGIPYNFDRVVTFDRESYPVSYSTVQGVVILLHEWKVMVLDRLVRYTLRLFPTAFVSCLQVCIYGLVGWQSIQTFYAQHIKENMKLQKLTVGDLNNIDTDAPLIQMQLRYILHHSRKDLKLKLIGNLNDDFYGMTFSHNKLCAINCNWIRGYHWQYFVGEELFVSSEFDDVNNSIEFEIVPFLRTWLKSEQRTTRQVALRMNRLRRGSPDDAKNCLNQVVDHLGIDRTEWTSNDAKHLENVTTIWKRHAFFFTRIIRNDGVSASIGFRKNIFQFYVWI